MLTVAWVSPFAPDRGGGGGQIRQAHLLLALAGRASIRLVCPAPVADAAVARAVAAVVDASPAEGWRDRHPWRRRVADVAAVLGSRQPMEVRAFAPVRRAVGAALAQPANLGVDLVLVEFAGLAPLVPPARPVPWVLTLHNLPSRMAAQQAAVMPHRRQRWLLRRDARIAGAFERRMAAAFDVVVTTTAEDAAALAGADPNLASRILVVPNGTDVDRLRPSPVPRAARVVFTGALYTTPNVDGVIWFCRHILPVIREALPAVEVDIVGARPTAAVSQLDQLPGVSVHPDVADVAPFLAAARVAVVPIRVGSGSRLKALEGMAAGRPVVGTTVGLEGLGIVPGVEALVADDATGFAAAVARLLQDDREASALAQAGRAAAEQRFGWPTIAGNFAAAMVELAGRPAASAERA